MGAITYASNAYNDDEASSRAYDEQSLLVRQRWKPSVVLPAFGTDGATIPVENPHAAVSSALVSNRHAYGNSHFERVQPRLDGRLVYTLPFEDGELGSAGRQNRCEATVASLTAAAPTHRASRSQVEEKHLPVSA